MSAYRLNRIVPNFGMSGLINGIQQPGMVFMDRSGNGEKRVTPPMRIPVEAFRKKNTETVDIVYESMKPVIVLIRIMGVLPITRLQPGKTSFKLASTAMVYSVVVYLIVTAHILFVAWERIKFVHAVEGRFEESVIAYLFLVYLLPNFLIPIFWYEASKTSDCFNHWMDFQIFYKRVTTRAIPINMKRRAFWIAIIVPIVSSASVFITHTTMAHFSIWQILPYMYVTSFINMLGAYWYMQCATISACANILAQDFKHAFRNNVRADTVAEYRTLWLQLNRIIREVGVAACYTFTILCLYLFFSLTLSIYGLFSQLQEGLNVKDIGLAVSACSSIVLLHVICDQAHSASQHVRTHFQKKLLLVDLADLSTDAQIEINMFLRATEMNPSDVSLGGFFDVNRNLFKSFLGTMVTYLVVLLQFQISLPEEIIAPNATLIE